MLRDTSLEVWPSATAVTERSATNVDLAHVDTLHRLLGLALDDFEKVLVDPRYAINVGGTYHDSAFDSRDGKRCDVCLAGAVMAKSLGVSPSESRAPEGFGEAVDSRLYALDALRNGSILDAMELMSGMMFAGVETGRACLENAGQAATLTDFWEPELTWLSAADNRRDGRRLLRKLRVMQQQLAAAGL